MESHRGRIFEDVPWIQNAIKNKWLEESFGVTKEYVRQELPLIDLQICSMSVREYCTESKNIRPRVVDCSYKIPKDVQENMQKVLQQHPEGIFPDMFEDTYEEVCNMELSLLKYGFRSVMSMVESLPFIFRVTFDESSGSSLLVSTTKEYIARRVVPTLSEIQVILIKEVQRYHVCGMAFETSNILKNPFVSLRDDEICIRGCRPVSARDLLDSVKEFVIIRTEYVDDETRTVLYPKCASCISFTVSPQSPESCLLCSEPNIEEEIPVEYPEDACLYDFRLERQRIFYEARVGTHYEIYVKSFDPKKCVLYGMLRSSMAGYNDLMYDLNERYSYVEADSHQTDYRMPRVKRILPNHLCAFKYGVENPGWYRGMIVGVHKTLTKALVFFLDLGHVREVNMDRVYMLKKWFASNNLDKNFTRYRRIKKYPEVSPFVFPLKIADLDTFKDIICRGIESNPALRSRLDVPNVLELSEKQIYELAFVLLKEAICSVKITEVNPSHDDGHVSIVIDAVNDMDISDYLLHLK